MIFASRSHTEVLGAKLNWRRSRVRLVSRDQTIQVRKITGYLQAFGLFTGYTLSSVITPGKTLTERHFAFSFLQLYFPKTN